MSVVNLWLSPDRAVVAVDTMAAYAGSASECSKVALIPHLNVVVAGRGLTGLLHRVTETLHTSQSFDEAVRTVWQRLPSIVRAFQVEEEAMCGLDRRLSILGPQEIYLVGWSPLAGRMVAILHEGTDGVFSRRELSRGAIAPHGVPISQLLAGELPSDRDEYIECLVRAQVCWGLAETGVPMFGGRLIVVEVADGRIACRTICSLQNIAST